MAWEEMGFSAHSIVPLTECCCLLLPNIGQEWLAGQAWDAAVMFTRGQDRAFSPRPEEGCEARQPSPSRRPWTSGPTVGLKSGVFHFDGEIERFMVINI